jgi:o-succinylbenzoate synthase
MPEFKLEFVAYRRPFAVPLRTARGVWYEREGVLLRLSTEDGRRGYGEIAPLSDFGTEDLAASLAWLRSLGARVAPSTLEACPRELTCCRFALSAALLQVTGEETARPPFRLENCALLPTGETALDALDRWREAGFRVFKLKIGVAPLSLELTLVHRLLANLPEGGRLRLDANASLDEAGLERWQAFLAGNTLIEFLEQPLPVGREEAMRIAQGKGGLGVALDESVSNLEQLERAVTQPAWRGPLVIKAAILGAVGEQRPLLQRAEGPLVFSSSFETAIGLEAVLGLAAACGTRSAVGGGTLAFFSDALGGYPMGPVLDSEAVKPQTLEAVWQRVALGFAIN